MSSFCVRIIGVVDLLQGRAVHAVAGERERYQPLAAGADVLARRYVDDLGVDAIYVADLDAIQHRPPQLSVLSAVCQSNVPVYVDAGVATVSAARELIDVGAARIIVGLETLPSFDTLHAISEAIGAERVIFSLDLRNGEPISTTLEGEPAERIAAKAGDAGACGVIVLDLARVGMGAGLDHDLIARVRNAVPSHVTLLAGGGVRGYDDLQRLADSGCDGALIGTAIHNGRIDAATIARARAIATSRLR